MVASKEEIKNKLQQLLSAASCRKFLLVCDSAFPFLNLQATLDSLSIPYETFSEFTPNPKYEDVICGVKKFQETHCDGIVAIGGGSTIDVAKCIKLFCKMDGNKNYLEQEFSDSGVLFIAIPTTAGTGSEATHFAVIYSDGKKISVAHKSLIPNHVILDASLLKTLPIYQKKCTMLDALCHGIESWWSVNSTEESKEYSKTAIRLILENKDGYLQGNDESASQMLLASNFAGKAINITKTTAAHAMSYKITSLYGLPHGYAVAICLPILWRFMYEHIERCVDKRGVAYVKGIFEEIAVSLGETHIDAAINAFNSLLRSMNVTLPSYEEADLDKLATSVNAERLKNNPVAVSESDFYNLYREILG